MPEWNEMQKAVIDFESGRGALLVTAAAGSGKTSVVAERVLHLVTRKEDPKDVSRLLVITFTNAAAEEMRDRIVKALRRAYEEDPGNRRLSRQLKLIHTAEFTTIDSFFLGIVRENFNLIGISPDARIAGEEEIGDLRDQVMEDLLEEKYAEASPEFLHMTGLFTRGRRDDALCRMIGNAYRAFRSMPEPAERLREAVALYENAGENAGETVWGRVLLDEAKRSLLRYLAAYEEMERGILREPEGLEAHLSLLREEKARLAAAQDTGYDWDRFRAVLRGFEFPTFPSGKRNVPEETKARRAAYKTLRDRLKEEIKKDAKLFAADEEACREAIEALRPAAAELERLVLAFSERFLRKKTEKRVLEFDDVSQYVYGLLWRRTPSGEHVLTEEAIRLAERYDEVIVDEYQDTNSLQDEIFRAVTRDRKNLIMVGDVKQSIYGFRYAEPKGFVDKLAAYKPLSEASSGARKQTLNLNYRSADGVIEAVNRVFSRLMTGEWGGLVYDRDQYLYRGRAPSESHPAEIFLLSQKGSADDRRAYEAREIARYVKSLVGRGTIIPDKDGERPMSYRDAAVLLRSGKGRLELYEKAFREEGVPVSAEGAVGLYSSPEGEFVLNLLAVVDNPYNDVALLTLLTSPPFGFSPEDLAHVRAALKKEPLIRALRQRDKEGDERAHEFLDKLDRWRREKTEKRLGLLIRGIYDELALSSLMRAGEDGEARLQNVYRIASAAEEYEAAGGLSAFLRGAALAVENGREPEGVSPASGKDAVRIMTIHKSKGLEFPVVILAESFTDVLGERNREAVNFDKTVGFGFKLHSQEKEIRYSTLTYEAVNCARRKEATAEELRILYVAMTRARERFALFAVSEDAMKTLGALADLDRPEDHVSPFHTFADWVMAAVLDRDKVKNALLSGLVPDLTAASGGLVTFHLKPVEAEETTDPSPAGESPEEQGGFTWPKDLFTPYPYPEAEELSTKTTATEIKNSVKNRELFKDPEGNDPPPHRESRRPAFMTEKSLTASERGNAVHLALRLIDFGKVSAPEEIAEELDRMERERFLSRTERESVDGEALRRFFDSPLGKRFRKAEKVYRELKFTLTEDAGKLDPKLAGKGETILLQGIVDAAFEEADGLILIDYKTDRLLPGETPEDHILKNGYDRQLSVYAGALTRMTGLPVRERWIWFTRYGKGCPVKEPTPDIIEERS